LFVICLQVIPSLVMALYTFAMSAVLDHPLVFFPLVLVLLFAAGWLGMWLKARYSDTVDAGSSSFKTLESAVLGLLALLLGFSFSMAVSRYDLRKDLEVGEANAIGTTWLRTSALGEPARTAARSLLKEYVPVRIAFFEAGTDQRAIADSLSRAGVLQSELWRVAADDANGHRDPVTALFLATLNDTIDFSEKRTAALENRIPGAAWALLIFMSCAASLLVGIGATARSRVLLLVLPLVVGSALTLILDLDSPRAGFVRIHQHSMVRVAEQMAATPQ
jgi:hypothetical protein